MKICTVRSLVFVVGGLCLAATVRAQADARIDGSSERAFKASLERAAKGLGAKDRKLFRQTIESLHLFAGGSRVRKQLNGATAAKVLGLGRKILKRLDRNGDGQLDDQEMITARRTLAAARQNANESAAIATLRNVASAQAQVQAMGVIDTDANGLGEYAFFAEMTGAAKVREAKGKGRAVLNPPVLSRLFAVRSGRVERSGYVYQIWLPGKGGAAVSEARGGGVDRTRMPAAKLAERGFVCYAWPAKNGETGSRVFAIDQSGDIVISDNKLQGYSGSSKPPSPYAALAAGTTKLPGNLKTRAARNDGGNWQRLQAHAAPSRRR